MTISSSPNHPRFKGEKIMATTTLKKLYNTNPEILSDGSFVSQVLNRTEKPYTVKSSYQVGGGFQCNDIIAQPHSAVICTYMSTHIERMSEWTVLSEEQFFSGKFGKAIWWYEVIEKDGHLTIELVDNTVKPQPIILEVEVWAEKYPWLTELQDVDLKQAINRFDEIQEEQISFSRWFCSQKWWNLTQEHHDSNKKLMRDLVAARQYVGRVFLAKYMISTWHFRKDGFKATFQIGDDIVVVNPGNWEAFEDELERHELPRNLRHQVHGAFVDIDNIFWR
jgi:hypothetical protein